MQVVITGAAGFIGSHLAKRLLNKGYNVIGVDFLTEDNPIEVKEFRLKELSVFNKFEFIKLDIVSDELTNILKERKCDYFVHLASKDNYYREPRDFNPYSEFFEVNTLGTIKMYELARAMGAKKFVAASTFSVYGNTKKQVLTERKLIPDPISPHGASKVAMEMALKYLNHLYELPCVIPRIFSVYGPNMPTHTLIYQTVASAIKGIPLVMRDDFVSQTRDFVYIDDVVDLLEASLSKRINFQIVNVASGVSTSLQDMINMVSQISGVSVTRDPGDDRPGLQRVIVDFVVSDIKKAEKMFKYHPNVGMNDGLKRTLDWYRENQDLLKFAYIKG
ncbi:MAG: NAD-dependent epimerase/dehydratase family protein [Patescibacteria group bacterium]|jgi:nucleoside-diphosphate-sugar epimerase